MPDILEWLSSHEPQWKRREPRAEETFVPRHLFGQEDAVTEWQHNEKPHQIFAQIASYEAFRANSALFLFGRRGSGKTALLHMLTHDVNNQVPSAKHYSRAVIVQPIVEALLPILRGSVLATLKDADLLALMRLAWRWTIISAAYIEIARAFPTDRASDSELASKFHVALDKINTGVVTVASYLINELLGVFRSTFERIPSGPNQLALTVIDLLQRLGSPSTQAIEIALSAVARKQKKPALVLIETEELYRLDDNFACAIRNALLDAVLEIYNSFYQNGLLAKAALPAEIYPFVSPANIEKIERKLVFILWGYRDLLRLAAKRYYRIVHGNLREDKLEKQLLSLEDFDHARHFLYTVMPPLITSRNRIELDTFGYIVRHTQKKPRQLIAIFNSIMTMAEDARPHLSPAKLRNEGDLISKAVHYSLDGLVRGALDIYEGIFADATKIVKKALTGMACYFSAPELDKTITQTNELRESSMTREDVRQLLLQAGVIGLAREAPVAIKDSEPPVALLQAHFEYQLKATLMVTNDSVCVIHPMFYEEFQSRIDISVLAYPKASGEEDALLQQLYGSQ